MRRSRKRLPRSCKESGADRGVEADLRPAKELETNIVTTHIGVVPSDPANERYQIMQEACFKHSMRIPWMHILQLKQDRKSLQF